MKLRDALVKADIEGGEAHVLDGVASERGGGPRFRVRGAGGRFSERFRIRGGEDSPGRRVSHR